jgi:hypothetical protein
MAFVYRCILVASVTLSHCINAADNIKDSLVYCTNVPQLGLTPPKLTILPTSLCLNFSDSVLFIVILSVRLSAASSPACVRKDKEFLLGFNITDII